MTIYVSNLSSQITESDLENLFEEYGEIKRIRISTDTKGKPRGFAFVEMTDEAQEDRAIADRDGTQAMGCTLRLNKAKNNRRPS